MVANCEKTMGGADNLTLAQCVLLFIRSSDSNITGGIATSVNGSDGNSQKIIYKGGVVYQAGSDPRTKRVSNL
jgi:hypothetical protein